MKKIFYVILGVCMNLTAQAEELRLDFDKLWNYQNPSETEQKFRALIPEARAKGKSYYLQLLTQLARTQSLQDKYTDAYETLNEVSLGMTDVLQVVKIRYLLELGRTQNAERKAEIANKTFKDAFSAADQATEWGYAVDALHMVAITYSYGSLKSMEEKLNWEVKAIAYAEEKDSQYAKAWLGSLYFNSGWSFYGLDRFEEALEIFIKAYNLDKANGSDEWILLDDRRTIAKVKRRLGRIDKALAEQHQLEIENIEKLGKPDGFVFEELGELYLVKEDHAKSKEYFAKAYPILKEILKSPEDQARLDRIKKLAGL
jgi:tetratricopeptide (TPR) repeat protein